MKDTTFQTDDVQNETFVEPILRPEVSRFVIFPINPKYQKLWDLYVKHENSFWRANEIDYTADLKDWLFKLTDNERNFLELILAFFAASDGIVLENLLSNFSSEVQISEARAFYAFQGMIENVHSLTYCLLIDTFITDHAKKKFLFNAIENIPVVKSKADWALNWIGSTQTFNVRLVAFAVVEGIFFSGAFCSIFWLKEHNKMTKALGVSNEFIARDEGLHVEFAVELFYCLVNKPDTQIIHDMFKEAVKLEKLFICEAIPCKMIGMNSELMSTYIEFVADRLLSQLGYPKIWNSSNPFPFMEKINMDGKSNFFEKRVSEYKMAKKTNKLDYKSDEEF
jgi:ribonucleoside-diphosphate reductase subunit M2